MIKIFFPLKIISKVKMKTKTLLILHLIEEILVMKFLQLAMLLMISVNSHQTWKNWKMKKKMLITGGLGFIGSHLVDALRDVYDITIIDDMSNETVTRF